MGAPRKHLPDHGLYNPANDPRVIKVRALYAEIINEMQIIREREMASHRFQLASQALSAARQAEAAAVAAIAWKD